VGAMLNVAPAGTPLVVVPCGTENLLARYVGNKRNAAAIARLVADGVVIRLDAGCAGGRLFSLMLSAGFDAEVVHSLHQARSGNISHLAYAWPIWKALRSYRFPGLVVRSASGEFAGSWLFCMNLPPYARGLPILPQATGHDGALDLCVLKKGSIAAGIWYAWNILRRRHQQLPSVNTQRVAELRIEPLGERPVPYQLDGDPGGHLPVDVKIVPERLSLVVRPEVAQRLGFANPGG
jgi:diacylglycerol kinase (ATP)